MATILSLVTVGRLRASIVNGIINQVNRLTRGANADKFSSLGGCTLSTTSATYVSITNGSKSFTKLGSAAETDLMIDVSLSAYATVAATTVKVGVLVNGTDNDATLMSINTANSHTTFPTGYVRLSGLAAGVYTVQLRALRVSGTGTVTMDASDTASMKFAEIPL